MSGSLTDLILSLTPEDGSSISNGAMMALLREHVPDLTDEDYFAARDALVDDGLLARGRGRGGSIMRVVDDAEDEEEEAWDESGDGEVDGFELVPTDEPAPRQRAASGRKKAARRPDGPVQVLSYRHGETRVNNPEVGMVHAGTDPDGEKTTWAYDPHLDPVLNFDSARAGIEKLIEEALPNEESKAAVEAVLEDIVDTLLDQGEINRDTLLAAMKSAISADRNVTDRDRMRLALEELRRLQAPYLNWTGKAERTSFEVDTVSLHVHERVDPATILANAAKRLKGKDAATQWRQPDLFAAPFENLPLRQALDFYHHEKGWSNRLVAGDSLLVMNSLLTKESMAGRVQMIYIDPPYGIKYGSNFQPFTYTRDVKDRSDEDLTQEPEMIKAFRDTWELGIHSYLTYLRDRLMLARELLSESGSVFVQISDENLHYVRQIMDEVFSPGNHVGTLIYQKTTGAGSPTGGTNFIPETCDLIVWYAKDKEQCKYRQLFKGKAHGEAGASLYKKAMLRNGRSISLRAAIKKFCDDYEKFRPYGTGDLTSSSSPESARFEVQFSGGMFTPGNNVWKTNRIGMRRLIKARRVHAGGGANLGYVRFIDDFPASPIVNLWTDTVGQNQFGGQKIFIVQTAIKAIERCLLMTTDPGDLVLDPTCGSGTTAFVAEKWGRRWITCDTSRVAITLAKQRLMTASFEYYALRYPHEGLKGGFDYETVPHITLKSIANNPDIDTIYDEDHPKIAAALADLNAALKGHELRLKSPQGGRKGQWIDFAAPDTQTFTLPTGQAVPVNALLEWEVPFDWPEDWPEAARAHFDAFHAARQAMQRRMDQSIADHAEPETLYDKPRKDPTKLRICGPFSVEAVPAPTVLSLDESIPPQEADETVARSGETSRQALWRDELLKTGVRGKGGAMLRFAEFETLPGLKHIHASGSLAETGERVVVSFGPEHAALEQRQVELALTEAKTLRSKLYHIYRDPSVSEDLNRAKAEPHEALPKLVQDAYTLLGADWRETRARWQEAGHHSPPVMLTVCNRTETAARIGNYFNKGDAHWPELHAPTRTLMVDSKVLEKAEIGETASSDKDYEARLKAIIDAADIPETRRQQLLALKKEELLREIVDNVGKRGAAGQDLQNVISVAMLSEGWDAKNVTHIMGLRAFTSQLLCEQVVGRGLRRVSYDTDENGLFLPEYVNVFGVPLSISETGEGGEAPPPPKPTTQIDVVPDRAHLELRWPNVLRVETVVKPQLTIDWGKVPPLVLDPTSTPISAELAPALGGATDMGKVTEIDLEKLPDGFRLQRLVFQAARKAFAELSHGFSGTHEYLAAQLVRIVEAFLKSDRLDIPSLFHSDPLRRRILIALNIDLVVQHVLSNVTEQNTERLTPVFDEENPIGATGQMRTWYTTKPCFPTTKSHISHLVGDSAWEGHAANVFEKRKDVLAYAKNDHLGFQVYYMWAGSRRRYVPDFLVRLAGGMILALEIKGTDSPQNKAKRDALNEWVKAINAAGGFGRWAWDVAFKPGDVQDIITKHAAVAEPAE